MRPHRQALLHEGLPPLEFELPIARDSQDVAGLLIGAAITGGGRKARGKRAIDLLIAATALSVGLPLYTRNIDAFSGLEGVLDIIEVRA